MRSNRGLLGLAFIRMLRELEYSKGNSKSSFETEKRTYTNTERKRILKRRKRNKLAKEARKKQMQYGK